MDNIVIIGSGNVATHLATELHAKGFNICQVYSRTIENANSLANMVNAEPISNISNLVQNAYLYLVCLSDSIIPDVVSEIQFEPNLIAHTAGSIPVSVLSRFKNYGVFYPLQTFSKNRKLNFQTIPFCIEANSIENKSKLLGVAKMLSNNVRELSTEQRKQCHLAAVFANNFTNHIYALAEKILDEKGLPFDILQPLIQETAEKVKKLSPLQAQTGPAIRNNIEVIQSHIKQLSSPDLEKIYSFVSDSIIKMHSNK